MVSHLALLNIPAILISYSTVFAMMPMVAKVMLTTHYIVANGELTACSGSSMVYMAAQSSSVSIKVIGDVY